MNNPIDDMQQFMTKFLGFGQLRSPYWFVGKEEGGERSRDEMLQRIGRWKGFGAANTVNLFSLDVLPEHTTRWYAQPQKTWSKLIQVIQVLSTGSARNHEIVSFQAQQLGRMNSNHCILELMPLPARSAQEWNYNVLFPEVPELSSRQVYFEHVIPHRIELIKKLVKEYAPRLVLFYSSANEYKRYWNNICGSSLWDKKQITSRFEVDFYQSDTTLYVVTPHPTRHGIMGDDFVQLAYVIQKTLPLPPV